MKKIEAVEDLKERISATYDTIIGLETSIAKMEAEIVVERRKQ
jgi:hypothetical protein